MGKLAANQRGFELVIVAAVIVVATILGTSGWLVYRDHYKTKSAGADSTTTAASQSTTSTNSAPSTKPIQTATKYLTVTEWGVSLPLPASIEKAYYVVPTGMAPASDGKPSGVFVSDHSLDSACGVLTADGPGTTNRLGEILRAKPTEVDPLAPGGSDETYAQVYPGGTTVDGWYYVFNGQPATDACKNASATASVVAGFKSAAASTVSSSAAASAQ